MRVLIGEISSYKAIVIARYIQQRYPNVELWAYDNKPMIRYIHSRYVKKCEYISYTTLEDYIQRLAHYVQENDIDILLPVHSDYIGQILKKKQLFGTTLDYLGEYSDYLLLHEKNQMMQIARELHINVPKEYSSIAEAQIPFVLKPTNLSSAKGVRYCYTKAEQFNLESISSLEGMICQDYIKGKGCGYEVYCKEGKIISEYGHLRLAEWPITGGSSVLRTGYIHPEMRIVAEKILGRVQWTGFAMFEFKLTYDNQLVLIEVNPRIWGSINQALQNECYLFSAMLGNPIKLQNKREVRTCLAPQVWLSMLFYLLNGRVDVIKDFLKRYRITRTDVSIWNDPKGILSMLIRKVL